MNEANRTAIVLLAAIWIVLLVIVIFLAWAAPGDAIEALGDVVQELDDSNDTAGRLVVTLGALALAVFGLLVIILELAPDDEERELKVKQAGSTTIVPAQALRQRVEEAIGALPEVTTVKARVWTQDNGIATNLDLGLVQRANVANVTQEASRLVVDIVQAELGLPVAGLPQVRIAFGGEKPVAVTATAPSETVDASSMFRRPSEASSTFQRPQGHPEVDPQEMMGGVEDAPPPEPPVVDATEGTVDAPPRPPSYDADAPRSEEGKPASQDRPDSRPMSPGYGGESHKTEEDKPASQDLPDSRPMSPGYGGESHKPEEDKPAGEPQP